MTNWHSPKPLQYSESEIEEEKASAVGLKESANGCSVAEVGQ